MNTTARILAVLWPLAGFGAALPFLRWATDAAQDGKGDGFLALVCSAYLVAWIVPSVLLRRWGRREGGR